MEEKGARITKECQQAQSAHVHLCARLWEGLEDIRNEWEHCVED